MSPLKSVLKPNAKNMLMMAVEPTSATISKLKKDVPLVKESFKSLSPEVKLPEVDTSPTVDIGSMREAARLEAERLRKKKGFSSTIATGQQGVLSAPQTLKATLG
jgi:hypothetical protein